MKCCVDFKIGYSPERINLGDEAHTLDKITKIVAGMDEETTEDLAELYKKGEVSLSKAAEIVGMTTIEFKEIL
uniref:Uncharacterized protein n=1 Tax=Candidatus Methanophaga sp. ANME-1 ERB7 TaxID=2759913 RepID=A0A7G9ZAI1_9EURY|nr:hypothetical protein HCLJFGEB_00009 [Methanosarcinales archaeon ANME-1 ERB7]